MSPLFFISPSWPYFHFREALAVLSETRQTTLLASFITALTRGGPSGYPRPIELHAHDPLRYVGDMLAWVHQAIAAEQEFLESLFGMKNDGRMVGSVRRFDSKVEEEEWIRELMDLAVGKLCVPLKVHNQHPPFLWAMFSLFCRRCEFNRRLGLKKAASYLIKLPTSCNFI